MTTCVVCGDPVHFASHIRGKTWVHDKPLGELKVSQAELSAVMDAAAFANITGTERRYNNMHTAAPVRSIE